MDMHHRRFMRILTCVAGVAASLLAGTVSSGAEPAETWPQWRGPTRDGFVRGTTWPTSLTEDHLQRVWHVDLQEIKRDRVTRTRAAKCRMS
jgi:hypothetical protein